MSEVPVPLNLALENLWNYPEAARVRVLRLLKKILQNVVNSPQEDKFQRLNIAKVTPKLTACGLGPVYIIQHAGFHQGDTHFELQAPVEQVQTVLMLVQEEENRRGALGAGDPVAPAAADGSGLSGEARQAQIDAEWDEIARKNREIRLAKKKEEEDRAREAALEQEALDKAAALLEEKLEEKPEASDADVEMGVEVPDEKAVSEVDLDQQIQDAMAEDAAAVEAEQTKVSESAASEEAVSADDTVSEWICPNCEGENGIDVFHCHVCETPIPEAVLKVKDYQSKQALKGEAAMQDDDGDAEIDPEMAEIISSVRRKQESERKKQSQKPKQTAKDSEPSKPLSEMTTEEKMEWLERRTIAVRAKRERDRIQAIKDKEKNRRELGKAQQKAQEMVEEAKRKAFIAQRKRERQDKLEQRRRLQEKSRIEKARRKREAEERAQEAERIRAAKAAGEYP